MRTAVMAVTTSVFLTLVQGAVAQRGIEMPVMPSMPAMPAIPDMPSAAVVVPPPGVPVGPQIRCHNYPETVCGHDSMGKPECHQELKTACAPE